jgi:ABC-type antimicrobial peptide transport system permease subunit
MDWFLRMSRVIAAFGVFGGLASALVAAVGLYGVIAFQVRSRTREIGVRMSVGAGSARILALFVGESLRRVLPGLGVGFAAALLVAPLVARVLPGTAAPPDALLLAVVALGMAAVGVLAALEPALRATRVEPQVVLRGD